MGCGRDDRDFEQGNGPTEARKVKELISDLTKLNTNSAVGVGE